MEAFLQGTAALLVQLNLLSKEQALSHEATTIASGRRLIPYLVEKNILSGQTIAKALANHFNLTYIDLNQMTITPQVLMLVSETLMHQYHILPICYQDNQLVIATDEPSQHTAIQDLKFQTGLHIKLVVAETTALTEEINRVLNSKEHQGLTTYFSKATAHPTTEKITPSNQLEEDAPVIKFVNRILHQAIEKAVSDIHFEPYDQDYRIRYRQDGILHEIAKPPRNLATRIAARLKVMANLDISERRLPQDGRFTITKAVGAIIDCRISTCPTMAGEKIVIRLMNTGFSTKPQIDSLSLNNRDKTCFIQALARPHGLILVTGPTGSGKSMTLYAALHHLNSGENNISTAEDPVELKIEGINQVQVNTKINLHFSTILRAFLRQDPDIIMIGEIRDVETAEIAIKASETGHLVLSTLHTNSAPETLTRLISLGIPAFHIVQATRLIVAQRLVRRLCAYCKYPHDDVCPTLLATLGYRKPLPDNITVYRSGTCGHCRQGYQGRIALFEVMPISSEVANIMTKPTINIPALIDQGRSEGMSTLYEAGIEQVLLGVTSLEEVHRVI